MNASKQNHKYAPHDETIQLEYICSVNGDADLLFDVGKGELIDVVTNASMVEMKEVLNELISELDHPDHSQATTMATATATATATTKPTRTRSTSDSSGTYRYRRRTLTRCHQRNNRSLAAKLKLTTCHSISIVIELATIRRRIYPFNQLILSPEEEQADKSLAGLSRPSLSTAKATIDMPLRTARTRPQTLSDVLTNSIPTANAQTRSDLSTSHTRIQPELTKSNLFEVYNSIRDIFNSLSLHCPLSALSVHKCESRPSSNSPSRELEFNTQLLVISKPNLNYDPVSKGDNRYYWYCKKHVASETVNADSIAMRYTPSSDNRSDDPHDGITETEMRISPTLSMDYGEHTSVDLKYPITKHRFQDETRGAPIESFLLTILWCLKKQATVVSLLSSLMKSKPVLSHRNLFLHRMGSDKM